MSEISHISSAAVESRKRKRLGKRGVAGRVSLNLTSPPVEVILFTGAQVAISLPQFGHSTILAASIHFPQAPVRDAASPVIRTQLIGLLDLFPPFF